MERCGGTAVLQYRTRFERIKSPVFPYIGGAWFERLCARDHVPRCPGMVRTNHVSRSPP